MFTADDARKIIEDNSNAMITRIEEVIKIAVTEFKTETSFRCPPEFNKQQAEKLGEIFSSAPRSYKVRVAGVASSNYGAVEYYAIFLSW